MVIPDTPVYAKFTTAYNAHNDTFSPEKVATTSNALNETFSPTVNPIVNTTFSPVNEGSACNALNNTFSPINLNINRPGSSLNDTFSPESTMEEVKHVSINTPVAVPSKKPVRFNGGCIQKEKLSLLSRKPTPYKKINKIENVKLMSPALSQHSASSTPNKTMQLITSALPLTKSNLKSIRKRSFSVDTNSTRKTNRVTFHSPANQEIPINEIDLIMETSRREIISAKERQMCKQNID